MGKAKQPQVSDALSTLVNQFSNPLSFYRELIQNSIDAGSGEIDVVLEFHGKEDSAAAAPVIIRIDDYGGGMTRDIIETRLTRLFSSGKDGDLTKIGRFGVGFVSVFAIKPDAVSVDTSRDGENWRVLFNKDKTFSLLAREEPVEGTKVSIITSMTRKQFDLFEKESRKVITFWCRYVNADIRFQGKEVNKPFKLSVPVQVSIKKDNIHAVVGISEDMMPRFGFYNRGLTLLEGEENYFAFASFIVNSRYLEHTITRDAIMEDENYYKALDTVKKLVNIELPLKLFQQIEQVADKDTPADNEVFLYRAAARCFYPGYNNAWPATKLNHRVGRQDNDNWTAIKGRDKEGVLAQGLYLTGLPEGVYVTTVRLKIDSVRGENLSVSRLEIYDSEKDHVYGRLDIIRSDFMRGGKWQEFQVGAQVTAGATLAVRVLFLNNCDLSISEVRLTSDTSCQFDLPVVESEKLLNCKVFRSPFGHPLSVSQVREASEDNKLISSTTRSAMTDVLEEYGSVVVLQRHAGEISLLRAVNKGFTPYDAQDCFGLPLKYNSSQLPTSAFSLLDGLEQLLDKIGRRVKELRFGKFDYPGSSIGSYAAVAETRGGKPIALEKCAQFEARFLSRGKGLVINPEHQSVQHLFNVAENEPELASYMLLKLFYLRGAISEKLDGQLAEESWELRCRRLSN